LPRKKDRRFLQKAIQLLDLRQLLAKKRVTENGKFRLGDWTVEPGLDRISRGGSHVSLQPQVMDLLVFLAQHRKEVISADEILERVWEGRVVTSASVYSSLKLLRNALGDDAHDPQYIATIPKRGYRLIAEVEFPENTKTTPAAHPTTPGPGNKHGKLWWPATVLAGAGLLAVLFLVVLSRAQNLQEPNTITAVPADHSVAVLPFTDMSPEQDQGWFCDGIAEEILNKLAQVPGLKVTGRVSSFAFRGPQTDLKTVGRTLGVAHLLEGSLRRDGDQVRVTAQLLRADDGFHLWSQDYDREIGEIFTIQDEISSEIASALQLKLPAAPGNLQVATQAIHPGFTAYERYLKALELTGQNTKNSLMGALFNLEQALEIQPDFADAHVAIALVYLRLEDFAGYYDPATGFEESRRLGKFHAQRALEIDPQNAAAYVRLADSSVPADPERLQALETALSLNPNLFDAHMTLGAHKNDYLLPWNEVISHLDRAVEIEPLSIEAATALVMWLTYVPHRWQEAEFIIANLSLREPGSVDIKMAEALWLLNPLGRPAEAIPMLEEILQIDPDHIVARSLLTKAWYMLGETERASKMPGGRIHWRYVLSTDRQKSLQLLNEESKWNARADYGRRLLSAYAYVMLHDWQSAVDLLAEETLDLDGFTVTYAGNLALNESPAMSLAVAYKALGDQEMYRRFADVLQKAVDIRTNNGQLHNLEYSRAMARLNALEGNDYEALLELERLITRGTNDPRELIHPAFDHMHDMPRFQKLIVLQRERVNLERQKLDLPPLRSEPSTLLTHAPE